MSSTFLFFALVAVMFFALQVATSFGLLGFLPAALEDGAGPHLSSGAWFFAGCCILRSSPPACRALSSSVRILAALVRELAVLSRDTTIAALKARVLAFEQNSGAAYVPPPGKQSLVDCEATIETLRRQINKLTGKVAIYERHYNVTAVDADRLTSHHTIAKLKLELQSKCDEISRLKDAIIHKRNDTTVSTLLCERNRLEVALEAKSKRVNELEPIALQHGRDMYQRDAQVAIFNALKEYIHRMVEAGGVQMTVVVLFLGALAGNAGIDLAELGIDGAQFQTYLDYAMAVCDGLPCPLLPQGGLRLHGIRYPLSGLRVFGNRVVEAGPSVVVASTPAIVAAASSVPPVGYNTFSAPPAIMQNARNTSCATQHVASAAPPFVFAGFTAPSKSPPAMPCPAKTSAPALLDPVPVAPSQPATNETRQMSFQPSKRPGTFGVGGGGIGKTSSAPRRS
ncbi:uncharacterized protein J4E92_000541 [Alternaria infectoria]|uniref:uncharacterized protein n=1 Tax=Alternaria infectoria TaxID=45303 RepID=UPI002220C774|nr:uncharacterized protein J4E92_000541 [Alternaria infectoria]KAI4939257.1 hypothetical protein J4E92_000541 [Alternaria infectoria]